MFRHCSKKKNSPFSQVRLVLGKPTFYAQKTTQPTQARGRNTIIFFSTYTHAHGGLLHAIRCIVRDKNFKGTPYCTQPVHDTVTWIVDVDLNFYRIPCSAKYISTANTEKKLPFTL